VSGRRSPLAWLAATLVLFGFAGCGATTQVGSNGTLQLALNEYRVTPQDVHAGPEPLTIFVHNYGRLTHNLVISLDGQTEVSTKPIAPGQTAELDAVLAPGKYLMASTILSDTALGAYGTLDISS
jgi:hypothetical protein